MAYLIKVISVIQIMILTSLKLNLVTDKKTQLHWDSEGRGKCLILSSNIHC